MLSRPDPTYPAYQVRAAEPAEARVLPEIERRAAVRFANIGLGFLADGPVTPADVFEDAGRESRLWVAAHGPEIVGFAVARILAAGFHLQEMDVVPEHGRRGLGRRLVEAVIEAARARGFHHVTLTTFRDIAWNGPFYARLGFEELPPERFSPEIRGLVAKEVEAGLVPDLRFVMHYVL